MLSMSSTYGALAPKTRPVGWAIASISGFSSALITLAVFSCVEFK